MGEEALRNVRLSRQARRLRLHDECRLVCNGPLRERFVVLSRANRSSASVVCEAMGWMKKTAPSYKAKYPNAPDMRPDVIRLRRVLGLAPVPRDPRGRKPAYYRTDLSYDMAVKLAVVLGMDPVEAGL